MLLTKLRLTNFKRFEYVEIELGNPVVFIGPNDSGKTTALQALALWDVGLRRWTEKRAGKSAPEKRPGVTINRKDLIALPVPDSIFLWRNRSVRVAGRDEEGKRRTDNIRIEIIVEGVSNGRAWECGLEFDYANEESFYCRPLRLGETGERMPIPEEAAGVHIAYLPPMSGLAANETRLDPGAVNVRLGEGRTAEVLRNLCYRITELDEGRAVWDRVCAKMKALFGVDLDDPTYVRERGEITMAYRNRAGLSLDLSCSGRGMQQTLLLLSHLVTNPKSVLLLDEPDAHLEILRQRQIYGELTSTARESQSQVIAASHSEVVLNEAADRDVVVAFVGQPHRIDDRGKQAVKALKEIGFEQYYQAEQTGWVLYLEGSTDLDILRAFAETLAHPARERLERPFVHYVCNQPPGAYKHFFGLREAKPDLVGLAVFDRLNQGLDNKEGVGLKQIMWERREAENYLCQRETLLAWARSTGLAEMETMFAPVWEQAMSESISEIEQALGTLGKGSPWAADTKVSDDFLTPLFEKFFQKVNLPNLMRKSDYHQLARHVRAEDLHPQVTQVLDAVVTVAAAALPVGE
ncbi:MAG: ATP-dependent endonuclease [Planctomycetota bacterium]